MLSYKQDIYIDPATTKVRGTLWNAKWKEGHDVEDAEEKL